ncbi:hypothetical protein CIK05_07525 [Bdellovibrio sp. qaytius]|nr:hypothetical protein CIK05_07525 [Bdellovibrio sp. qaytius]
MRFMILTVVALMGSSIAFAGSGFEGIYKVERISENTGSWQKFWLRPNVEQLEQITIEETSSALYIGLQDAQGLTWSANYGVCPDNKPSDSCNAYKSLDGKTLQFKFWGDMSWFVITLGEKQGKLEWTDSDLGSASLVFDHVKK